MVITDNYQPPIPTRAQITVCISNITGIKIECKGNLYQTIDFLKPKKVKEKAVKKEPVKYTPPETHYYKKGQNLFPRLRYEESKQEVLDMLQEGFFWTNVSFV